MRKLDYGSGSNPKKGFLSSDFVGKPGFDYYIKNYKVLGTKSKSFDVIHCRNVIHHIPESELPKLFAEFERLLKPNGHLIISEPRQEFFVQNKILDIIWYRWIANDYNINLPENKFVEYKDYLYNFKNLSSYNHFNNEVIVFQKQIQTLSQVV